MLWLVDWSGPLVLLCLSRPCSLSPGIMSPFQGTPPPARGRRNQTTMYTKFMARSESPLASGTAFLQWLGCSSMASRISLASKDAAAPPRATCTTRISFQPASRCPGIAPRPSGSPSGAHLGPHPRRDREPSGGDPFHSLQLQPCPSGKPCPRLDENPREVSVDGQTTGGLPPLHTRVPGKSSASPYDNSVPASHDKAPSPVRQKEQVAPHGTASGDQGS
jgi:hypothetical protein